MLIVLLGDLIFNVEFEIQFRLSIEKKKQKFTMQSPVNIMKSEAEYISSAECNKYSVTKVLYLIFFLCVMEK